MLLRKAIVSRRRKCKRRVRSKVSGTDTRPRLTIFRSNRQIYVQLIDDIVGRTLLAVSTKQPALAEKLPGGKGSNVLAARVVGKVVAEQALAKGISKVCFDRSHYRYHGRVKAVADAAREAGLLF